MNCVPTYMYSLCLIPNKCNYYNILNSCFWHVRVIFMSQTALVNAKHHRIAWYFVCTRYDTPLDAQKLLNNLNNIPLNNSCWIQHSHHILIIPHAEFNSYYSMEYYSNYSKVSEHIEGYQIWCIQSIKLFYGVLHILELFDS